MTIDFICEELAELFDSPCNYSPMDEKMFQDSYCESHCGKVTDKECWKQYFKKMWADRKTEPSGYNLSPVDKDINVCSNSSEKPNNCETCKHNKLEWYSEVCDGCSKAHSNYEPQTEKAETMSCQECKWWFTDSLKHGGYCQSFLYNQECRYEPQERSK